MDIEQLTTAAKYGDASAQFILGCCYENGNGVPKDIETALLWITESAQQGYTSAQCYLGRYYSKFDETELTGHGKHYNPEMAKFWLVKAAEQGNAIAQCELGDLYINLGDDDCYLIKADSWYKKAAEQGLKVAQSRLEKLIK